MSGFGAYGLRLDGIAGAEQVLVPASEGWPLVRLDVRIGADDAGAERFDDRSAHLRLRTGGYIDIDRDQGLAVFTVPSPLSPEALVHPYLAPVAAVTAHWYGRESFHAGGIAIGETAWAIVGDRHTGKSSTLAALAAAWRRRRLRRCPGSRGARTVRRPRVRSTSAPTRRQLSGSARALVASARASGGECDSRRSIAR